MGRFSFSESAIYSLRKRQLLYRSGDFLQEAVFLPWKPDCVQERRDLHTFGSPATPDDWILYLHKLR